MSSGVNGTSGSSSSSGTSSTSTTTTDPYSKLGMSDFIKLLVSELQNQDPTSPVDNSTILNEVSQIDSIQATQGLSTTLSSVQLGQSLATASNLLGHTVTATDSSSNPVSGTVNKVTVSNGTVQLEVGSSTVNLSSVSEIDP